NARASRGGREAISTMRDPSSATATSACCPALRAPAIHKTGTARDYLRARLPCMPGEADELILRMRHLEAEARAQEEARRLEERGKSLESRAQQMAWAAQIELDSAEKQQREGEEQIERARTPGMPPLEAADLLTAARQLAAEGRTRAVKARARLNYALDQMD